jgi:hypothetical protein
MKATAKRMNPRQRRFVAEYMTDFVAQAAAGRAGYSLKNGSIGLRLMNNPLVQAEIRRRCLLVEQRLEFTTDDVRRGFCRIASDPREVADGGPSFEARISALTQLGRLLGMYSNKLQVSGGLTLVDLLLAARSKSEVDLQVHTDDTSDELDEALH